MKKRLFIYRVLALICLIILIGIKYLDSKNITVGVSLESIKNGVMLIVLLFPLIFIGVKENKNR